ncbi:MAG: hypothetical protein E6J71_01570 [Deltaproteobacteria bacterium]|nr:MAG: hypothetical protein E6J81_14765 [Deltaproteobacteria bacterium]TMA78828.1 MAG: hypothetical protein E6J77_20625 [Deltaproteobacteria bacterium]TMB24375.1 MAG: hypothetical protein E6J71_01570 [Deltaproteobacteria bacterium]
MDFFFFAGAFFFALLFFFAFFAFFFAAMLTSCWKSERFRSVPLPGEISSSTPQPPARVYGAPSRRVKRTPAFWKFFFKFSIRPGLRNRRPKMTFTEILAVE